MKSRRRIVLTIAGAVALIAPPAMAQSTLGTVDYMLTAPADCASETIQSIDSRVDIPMPIRFLVGPNMSAKALSGSIAGEIVPAGMGAIRSTTDTLNIKAGVVKANGLDQIAFNIAAPASSWCAANPMRFTFLISGDDQRVVQFVVHIRSEASVPQGLSASAPRAIRTMIDKVHGPRIAYYFSGEARWHVPKSSGVPPDAKDHLEPGDFCYRCSVEDSENLSEGLGRLAQDRGFDIPAGLTDWSGAVDIASPSRLMLRSPAGFEVLLLMCRQQQCAAEPLHLSKVERGEKCWGRSMGALLPPKPGQPRSPIRIPREPPSPTGRPPSGWITITPTPDLQDIFPCNLLDMQRIVE